MQSRNHHYLPVFYLKRFTNENGKLNIYNKLNDTFLKNIEPESFFYERDLNNVRIDGKIELSTEVTIYRDLDNQAASTAITFGDPDGHWVNAYTFRR